MSLLVCLRLWCVNFVFYDFEGVYDCGGCRKNLEVSIILEVCGILHCRCTVVSSSGSKFVS
jgi:hypothetical protein